MIRADYETECPVCGYEIYPGDFIELDTGAFSEWVHKDCASEKPTLW